MINSKKSPVNFDNLTIGEAYNAGCSWLPSTINEAHLRLLFLDYLNLDNYWELKKKANELLPTPAIFTRWYERLIANEPPQYISGKASFCGHSFKVDRRVLIPRPETEELVMLAIEKIKKSFPNQKMVIADIGTGSGAIAISLAKSFPQAEVYATDISLPALELARENSLALNADVTFISGDLLDPLIERGIKVDILISNPPYIDSDLTIDPLVWENEPHLALLAKPGITNYEKILTRLSQIQKNKTIIFFEFGIDQKDCLEDLVSRRLPKAKCTFYRDMQNIDRMLMIESSQK
ncbi:MAG TPA: peptide chain release factor N(5)-glutamine methyltransferase [Bacilli bacterium]|nr:peptide chain release factor N(5)-glutamine methyltransferase [Bacilli bacterium]